MIGSPGEVRLRFTQIGSDILRRRLMWRLMADHGGRRRIVAGIGRRRGNKENEKGNVNEDQPRSAAHTSISPYPPKRS